MFIFSHLGRTGSFGHQLFQIAATIGLAVRHGVPYLFPRWGYSGIFQTPVPQADQLPVPDIVLAQSGLHIIDISLSIEKPFVIDLGGSFQSDIYFAHCTNTIASYFAPAAPIVDALTIGYGDRFRNAGTCAIIANRADYLAQDDRSQTEVHNFYTSAMSLFDPDTEFLVMSDDTDWCRQHIRGPHVTFLRQSAWIHNFFLGTLCQHTITSCTTLGWWCAYLNAHPDKCVVAPRSWFGPEHGPLALSPHLPRGWVTL